jgi:hypothetical protein
MKATDRDAAGLAAKTSPKPSSTRPVMPAFSLLGHTVAPARTVEDLETALALENTPSTRTGTAVGSETDGLESPSAIPYCDFLLVRDAAGAPAGMVRLVAHGPDIPVRNLLANDRFQLSPLLTALRYSRLDVVEAGPLRIRAGRDPGRIASLLWRGIQRYAERSGASILIGRELLPARLQGAALAALQAAYGLHPDLEVEARAGFRAAAEPGRAGGRDTAFFGMPHGLQEALERGCRLAGEPVLSADRSVLEAVWVAFRDMLGTPGDDWRHDLRA